MNDAPPSALWGGLRWVQKRRVSGWAYAPRRPDEHLHVEARLDGAVVGTASADQVFDYLEHSGICPADHGFLIQTDLPLPLDAPERLEISALASTGDRLRLTLPSADEAAPVRGTVRFLAVDRTARPVFVLGAKRSATSAVGRALRKSGRYAGHGEGHLLTLLPLLLEATTAHYADQAQAAAPGQFTMLAGAPARQLSDGIAALFIKLMRAQFPTGRWMEKTPGAASIRAAPRLHAVWPAARFVFLQRRGYENIESARRKFPDLPFQSHCEAWADAMHAWHQVRDILGPAAIVLDQLDVARQTFTVADRLRLFLALTDEEANRLLQALRGERPQQTGDDPGQILDPAALAWTDQERAVFDRICGDAMNRSGYTSDTRYDER